jgi:general secretion pathway protein J
MILRRRSSDNRSLGFTLIELLVALTILALMSMLAWRGLDGVLRARDAAITARDKISRLQGALEQMGADVRSATSGRSNSPITIGATGFALERELAQANGPARRATVQWQLSEGTLIRTVQGEVSTDTAVLQVLPRVNSWTLAVYVNGNWLPAEEWLKQQSQVQAGVPAQPQAGAIAAGVSPANAGRIVALSIKLILPDGEVTKVLLTESL